MNAIITKMSRVIMPSMSNGYDILFGGQLMSWMDEISGIAAGRYARSRVITAAVENISLKKPIKIGEFIDIEGTVISVGNTSLRVLVNVRADRENGKQEDVAEAIFVYVALDDEGKPKKVVIEE